MPKLPARPAGHRPTRTRITRSQPVWASPGADVPRAPADHAMTNESGKSPTTAMQPLPDVRVNTRQGLHRAERRIDNTIHVLPCHTMQTLQSNG